MLKECVILNGQIINIGPWDYQPDEEGTAKNPLPAGATSEQRNCEYDPDRGWYEVGTTPQPTEAEQIASLKARLATAEQSAADNSLITQQLLETLIDLEVI